MQANPRNIDALFNSQIRYVVPMFQRLYVWGEVPQWQTLWDDVQEKANLQLKGSAANPHYLGALIVEGVRPSSPREVKRFLVIDGQQRLTTLQLLLCAFRDYARSRDWKSLDRTAGRYLENTDIDVMENPNEERFKLWPTQLNRQVFSDIILAGSLATVEKKYPLVWIGRRRKPEPRNALVNAYVYFSKCISSWICDTSDGIETVEETRAFKLLQSLQQDFSVVEISLSEGDDSQEIFYSLNSQGRPLSQSDLLRSLIFMRAEKERVDRDAIFGEFWSKFETQFWSTEIRRAGRTFSRLDLALRYFLSVKTARVVDARRVNEEYRVWISEKPQKYPSVREELSDFSRFAEVFQRFEELPDSTASTELLRVLRDVDVSTALPLVMFLELEAGLRPEEHVSCKKILESFIVRRAFTGEENKEYNKLFVEVVAALQGIGGDGVREALVAKLLTGGGSTRVWPSDEKIVERSISGQVYDELRRPTLRLILERIELWLRSKKSEDLVVQDGLQIEHVLPQVWSRNWPIEGNLIPDHVARYPSMASEELSHLADKIRVRNSAVQTIGNLTLLNKYLNPAASNGGFELKKTEYANSVLRINRYFDSQRSWDEVAIQERGRMMGEAICSIWPRPASLS